MTHTGYARATDGLNYTSNVTCGSVTVADPPPPPPTWVSTPPPATCKSGQLDALKVGWLNTFGPDYYTPSPFTAQWLFHDDDKRGGKWRVWAQKRSNGDEQWTTGTFACGGNTGV
ncbi:hypothetical protein QUV83_14055 [Cellulomonas cellasea]|uniref:hypothetical protein n=1 Tax=Cellulomonas cellasea TaxID=43670 RepID=UPI0025A336DA|nr:hypothetical protein [Cellulomonas cellasea]MDM8085896.1 hypothetical protein [Cellulomonas cellasea]